MAIRVSRWVALAGVVVLSPSLVAMPLGDLNGNGHADLTDAMCAVAHALDAPTALFACGAADDADLTCDGIVDITDVSLVIQSVLFEMQGYCFSVATCDDGDPCTYGDRCTASGCVGDPLLVGACAVAPWAKAPHCEISGADGDVVECPLSILTPAGTGVWTNDLSSMQLAFSFDGDSLVLRDLKVRDETLTLHSIADGGEELPGGATCATHKAAPCAGDDPAVQARGLGLFYLDSTRRTLRGSGIIDPGLEELADAIRAVPGPWVSWLV